MIVDKLHIVCIGAFPPKADPPLSIDANTPLSATIAFAFLESIGWWDAEILKGCRGIKHSQFPQSDVLERTAPPPDGLTSEQLGGAFVAEAADHSE